MNKFKFLIAMAFLLFVLSACGTGYHAITEGHAYDYVSNIEETANDYFTVWVRNDITSAYCTNNKRLVERATEIAQSGELADITYKGFNAGEDDSNWGQCDLYIHEGTTTYRLVSIRAASDSNRE